MGFLAPLFLVGLAALAIPVLIHLIQRERKRVVEFPSLMFLRKIPYQSVRRRRIRDWLLLAMRLAALALIVLAFARPFFRRTELAAATQNGAREVVILLDISYSMEYGDRWQKAKAAAARRDQRARARQTAPRWCSSRRARRSRSARPPIAAGSSRRSPRPRPGRARRATRRR